MKWQWCRTKERAIIYCQEPGKGVGLRTFLWGDHMVFKETEGDQSSEGLQNWPPMNCQRGEIGRILKNFMGDQVNSIVTQPKSSKPLQNPPYPSPPPPRRAINDCSLMQINVSYATFTDISSINLNSLSLIRVVRIVKKELFLSYKTS